MGKIIIPSLPENIPKKNSSLEPINKIFLKYERGRIVKLPIRHFYAVHGYLYGCAGNIAVIPSPRRTRMSTSRTAYCRNTGKKREIGGINYLSQLKHSPIKFLFYLGD
jgi:hypothetical protein